MANPSTASDASTGRGLHRLIEHYTPQGTLGRVLLGVVALGLSPVLLLGAVAGMGGFFSLLPFVAGVLSLVGGVAAALVGVVALWPVYLSAIGNVESPADYMGGTAGRRRSPPASLDAEETDLDAEELLKRRYASGDLSREEFERRLDTLLDGDERRRGGGRGRRGRELERE